MISHGPLQTFRASRKPQMSHARFWNAVDPPAMDGRNRRVDHTGYCCSSTQSVDDDACFVVHERFSAIIGTLAQEKYSDNSNCDNRTRALHVRMDNEEILRRMALRGLRRADIARHLGLQPNKITKTFNGERQFKVAEMDALRQLLTDDTPPIRTIPIIGQVAAGNWREAIQQSQSSIPAPDPSVPPRSFGLRVVGDSMDLYVDEGGTAVVDPDDKHLYPGRFYVILNQEGEATFKQFNADPARLTPCSTNPAHSEILIGGEKFDVVGRIIWRATRM